MRERIAALAKYLNVKPEEIAQSTWDYFGIPCFEINAKDNEHDGEEWLVADEDEAYEAAKEDIKNLFDDIGMDSFTPWMRDWICENALEQDWFEEAHREDCNTLASEYRDEDSDDDRFENRLVEEAFQVSIITEEDFSENDAGSWKYDGDMDQLEEEYADYLFDEEEDHIQWFVDHFGEHELSELVARKERTGYGPDIDMDAVADKCIDEDGVAHFISHWDGKEVELEDNWLGYRYN